MPYYIADPGVSLYKTGSVLPEDSHFSTLSRRPIHCSGRATLHAGSTRQMLTHPAVSRWRPISSPGTQISAQKTKSCSSHAVALAIDWRRRADFAKFLHACRLARSNLRWRGLVRGRRQTRREMLQSRKKQGDV